MNPIRTLARAVTLATLASAASFTVQAAGIPIGSEALESHVTTQVTAIDLATRQVTVKGPDEKKDVTFQLTEKAKALPNLKVGDQVDIYVTRAVAYVLNPEVGGRRKRLKSPVPSVQPSKIPTRAARRSARSRLPLRSRRSTSRRMR